MKVESLYLRYDLKKILDFLCEEVRCGDQYLDKESNQAEALRKLIYKAFRQTRNLSPEHTPDRQLWSRGSGLRGRFFFDEEPEG